MEILEIILNFIGTVGVVIICMFIVFVMAVLFLFLGGGKGNNIANVSGSQNVIIQQIDRDKE